MLFLLLKKHHNLSQLQQKKQDLCKRIAQRTERSRGRLKPFWQPLFVVSPENFFSFFSLIFLFFFYLVTLLFLSYGATNGNGNLSSSPARPADSNLGSNGQNVQSVGAQGGLDTAVLNATLLPYHTV